MFDLNVAGSEVNENGEDVLVKSQISSKPKKINFDILSKNLILTLVFLLPLFFLPLSLSSLPDAKTSLLYVFVLIPVILALFKNFKKESINIPWNLFGLSIVLIPFVYIISGFSSSHLGISFLGRDLALDSVITVLILFCLMTLVSTKIGSSKKQVLCLYLLLFLSSVIVFLLQIINLLIPAFPSLGLFNFSVATTLGKWNDLGLFASLMVILSTVTIYQVKLIKPVKIFLYVTFVLNLIIVSLVNFNLSWYLLGIFSIGFLVYQLVQRVRIKKEKVKVFSKITATSLIVLFVSLIFLIYGGFLGNKIYSFLNISHLEARPDVLGTVAVTKDTLKESTTRLLLGSGPATFEAQWPKYRPQSVLETGFWNNDFRYGYGLILSFVATTGIIGAITWLFFFMMLIIFSIKAFMKKIEDAETRFVLQSSFLGMVTLWTITLTYLPSTPLFALTFVFTGIFVSALSNVGLFKTRQIQITKDGKKTMVFILINVALIIFVILVGYKMSTKFTAQVYFQKSIVQLSRTSDGAEAEADIIRASKIDPIDTYFRSIAEINTAKLDSLLVAASNGEDVSQEDARIVANTVIEAYDKAIAYDQNNYNNYLGLANFYRGIVQLGTEGVYEVSKSFYGKVLELKPNNPLVYLEAARLEAINGDLELARLTVDKALELKPNYTDAAFFVVQLEINRGKPDFALKILKDMTKKTPNDPIVFFQLGVLEYNLNLFNDAVVDLEQSLRLNPRLQNARYFLGLSYYEVGKIGNAIKQFERLRAVNKGNEEINVILDNLNKGNHPFNGFESNNQQELPLEDTVEESVSVEEVVDEE